MEWVPKLYDAMDSAWFEVRMRLAAVSPRRCILIMALLVLLTMSPVFRGLVISAAGMFLIAELVSGLWSRSLSDASHRRRLATR